MNPYILLGALGAAIVLAGSGVVVGIRHERAIYEAVLVKERADAAKAASDFAAKSAAQDAHIAELSRNLEADHAKAIADAAATADDFARRLRTAVSAARRGCLPPAAANPGVPAQPAAGGDGGRGDPAVASGVRLRDVVLRLQADVKLCYAWAHEVGR